MQFKRRKMVIDKVVTNPIRELVSLLSNRRDFLWSGDLCLWATVLVVPVSSTSREVGS